MYDPRNQQRRGFSLVELLVVIAILALLVGLLLPVFWTARQKAYQETCLTNMRQLNAALSIYVQDNNSVFPCFNSTISWPQTLNEYVRKQAIFRCPACVIPSGSEEGTGPWGYATNSYLSLKEIARDGDTQSEQEIPYPASTVSFCETSFYREGGIGGFARTTMAFQPESESNRDEPYVHNAQYLGTPGGVRHQGGSNYGFVDGHVRWHKPNQVWSATRGNDGQNPSFGLETLIAENVSNKGR